VYQVQQGTTSTALYANKSNPANILYDYLTNTTFGKGLDPADIDIDSFVAARNYYNTINLDFIGIMQTSETIFDNVQQLLASSNANLYYSRGKYAISIHKQETFDSNTFVFSKDNILGEWTISLGSKANRFNEMTVNYYDSSNGWQPNSIKVENSTYLAADSGVLNEGGIDLPMVRIKADAQRLGKFYLDQSRHTTVVNFKASHEALQLDVNDIVYIDHETPGWTDSNKKKFRVSALVLNSDSTVDVTLMEYAPDTVYIENQ
jgi:predicted phage tail protein